MAPAFSANTNENHSKVRLDVHPIQIPRIIGQLTSNQEHIPPVLLLLALVSRSVSAEARSYLYANNQFVVTGGLAYFIPFLQRVGAGGGRKVWTRLELCTAPKYDFEVNGQLKEFWGLMKQCVALRECKIEIRTDHMLSSEQRVLDAYTYGSHADTTVEIAIDFAPDWGNYWQVLPSGKRVKKIDTLVKVIGRDMENGSLVRGFEGDVDIEARFAEPGNRLDDLTVFVIINRERIRVPRRKWPGEDEKKEEVEWPWPTTFGR